MTAVWIPRSADMLVQAIADGTLAHESAAYEYKRELPSPRDNKSIAVDVAAMATAGGIIIYGVAEDKKAATLSAEPIALAGAKDRISDVVGSQVREPPYFEVTLVPLATDSSMGYVVVDIPASPRAPHMVEVKGEYRFYGRMPGGNFMLTESQVAHLYERRERTEREAMQALDEAIRLAPIPPSADRCDLHLVVHPLVPDDGIRERILPDSDQVALHNAVARARQSIQFSPPWDPNFADVVGYGHREKTLEGTALVNPPFEGPDNERVEDYVARLEVTDTGTVRYFHAHLSRLDPPGGPLVRDSAIAQITAHLAVFAGRLYAEGSYHGLVDISVAVVGIEGAASADRKLSMLPPIGGHPVFGAAEFRDRLRTSAEQLFDDPCSVSRQLLARLLRVVRADGFRDPLATGQR